MVIKDANLEIIATRRSQYPMEGKPEFLLVGRSNVGKSRFINSILSRKNLAYTSAKPGKTQTLNFYNVNNSFYLIDVPGYGYASVEVYPGLAYCGHHRRCGKSRLLQQGYEVCPAEISEALFAETEEKQIALGVDLNHQNRQ